MSNNIAAVAAARDLANQNQDDLLEVEGYTVRVKAIPAAIISDVTRRIPEPEVPLWHNPEMNRDEANSGDPGYIKAKDDVDRQRGEAMIDATVMFGIELPDGVPPTEEWLPRLQFMQKRGQIDLSGYDLSDPLELEFMFKRYIIANIALITFIQRISSVTPEDVGKAGQPFRRKA
jgi:hypothetical protein